MSNELLENIVKSVLAERFPDASVERVVVRPDTDHDGDKILLITVVLSSRVDQLDRDNLVGFVRHLRPRLPEENADEFPHVRFVSASEAKILKLEAA